MKRGFITLAIIVSAAAILAAATAYGQLAPIRLLVSEVESDETPFVRDDAYPVLSLDVTPANAAGVPIGGLDRANFNLFRDGVPVEGFELTTFVKAEQPVSLMFVVDLSESMRDDLPRLKDSLISLYDILEQIDESGVIAFSLRADGTGVSLAEPFPQLDPMREMTFTNDEGALINLVHSLAIEEGDGAPVYDALVKGVRMAAVQARHERRAVILITDGSDADRNGNPPGSNKANAETAVREARQLSIPIFTVGIGPEADATFLEWAAANSGGAYWNVADANQVAPALATITAQLRQTYRLQYTASPPADDAIHAVTVGVRTDSATAEVTVEYKARYPIVPLVREVMAGRQRQALQSLPALGTVKGTVIIEPDIVARGNVSAVNYYVDENQTAVFSAREAPWTFSWDTSRLAPEQLHQLVIEVLDDGDPPHVGLFETAVFIGACSILCQFEQRLGFNPVYLVTAGLGAAALAVFLTLRSRTRTTPPHVPQARPQAAGPPQQYYAPRPANELDPFHLFVPGQVAQAVEKAPEATPATEVLEYDPKSIAFLIDPKSGRPFRLGVQTTIGRDPGNDLVLDEIRVADRHARVLYNGTQYVLSATNTTHLTKVNRQEVSRHELVDGDRIELGDHLLVFKQVK
ncbi:MAG TPA: FHA domain-containing protein [Anaerolineae bacterium]